MISCVAKELKCKFRRSGFFILSSLPIFGASPDAISEKYVIEVKRPSTEKTCSLYIKNEKISEKCNAQVQLQMMCARKKKALFCVASPYFEQNNKVKILHIDYNESFVKALVVKAIENWKNFVFPKLYKSAS